MSRRSCSTRERTRRDQSIRHCSVVLDVGDGLREGRRLDALTVEFRDALELLREVQQTGDIFFPSRWTEATLGGHRSPEAAGIVRGFLAGNPEYPQRLRWTILTAADELFRVTR